VPSVNNNVVEPQEKNFSPLAPHRLLLFDVLKSSERKASKIRKKEKLKEIFIISLAGELVEGFG
jgi:hypothetical protein